MLRAHHIVGTAVGLALLVGCAEHPRLSSVQFDEHMQVTGLYGALADYSVGGINGRLEFDIVDVDAGWIADIEDVRFRELVTPRRGDVLTVKPTIRVIGGREAAVYEAAWTVARDPADDDATLLDVLVRRGSDATRYASLEITAKLGGGRITYRALALYDDSGDVEILDEIVGPEAVALVQDERRDPVESVLDRLEIDERRVRERYAKAGASVVDFETSSVSAVAHIPIQLLVTESDEAGWHGATLGEVLAASPQLTDVTRVGHFVVTYDDAPDRDAHRAVVLYRDREDPDDPEYAELLDLILSI